MILTQVVLGKNVFKNDDATVQNLLLKINMKLGGNNYYMHTNWTGKKEGRKEECPWTRIDILRAPGVNQINILHLRKCLIYNLKKYNDKNTVHGKFCNYYVILVLIIGADVTHPGIESKVNWKTNPRLIHARPLKCFVCSFLVWQP